MTASQIFQNLPYRNFEFNQIRLFIVQTIPIITTYLLPTHWTWKENETMNAVIAKFDSHTYQYYNVHKRFYRWFSQMRVTYVHFDVVRMNALTLDSQETELFSFHLHLGSSTIYMKCRNVSFNMKSSLFLYATVHSQRANKCSFWRSFYIFSHALLSFLNESTIFYQNEIDFNRYRLCFCK